MAREDALTVEGAVVEVLSARTYRVELPNGHRLLAYLPGQAPLSAGRWAPGDKVRLQMSPYDLSEGRIIVERRAT
jgi:translation initiation factor IF-1